MTAAELAKEWGVSRQRVQRWIQDGSLDKWIQRVQVNNRTYTIIDPQAIHHRPPDRRKKRTDDAK